MYTCKTNCGANGVQPFDNEICDRCWLNRRAGKHSQLAIAIIERVIEPMLDRHARDGYAADCGLQGNEYDMVLDGIVARLKRP
jgi:hypothetical protein